MEVVHGARKKVDEETIEERYAQRTGEDDRSRHTRRRRRRRRLIRAVHGTWEVNEAKKIDKRGPQCREEGWTQEAF